MNNIVNEDNKKTSRKSPPTLKQVVIFVGVTSLALVFFYGATSISPKILENLKKMGV